MLSKTTRMMVWTAWTIAWLVAGPARAETPATAPSADKTIVGLEGLSVSTIDQVISFLAGESIEANLRKRFHYSPTLPVDRAFILDAFRSGLEDRWAFSDEDRIALISIAPTGLTPDPALKNGGEPSRSVYLPTAQTGHGEARNWSAQQIKCYCAAWFSGHAFRFISPAVTFDYDLLWLVFERDRLNRPQFGPDEKQELQQRAREYFVTVGISLIGKNSQRFLEENRVKDGVITTASGLQYRVIHQGDGRRATPGQTVLVNYRARLADGAVFDNTYARGEPVPLIVGEKQGVIAAWDEVIGLVDNHAKWELFVPPALGFGDKPGPGVPPNSVLIFEFEVMSIED